MEARELRIGNNINLGDKVVIVDLDVINRIGNAHYETTPILLTDEWLNKLGMNRRGYTEDGEVYCKDDMAWIIKEDAAYHLDEYPHEIKYVHQLQNLLFALTGEELTIK